MAFLDKINDIELKQMVICSKGIKTKETTVLNLRVKKMELTAQIVHEIQSMVYVIYIYIYIAIFG